MTKPTAFYATEKDLRELLAIFEANVPIKYVLADILADSNGAIFHSASDLFHAKCHHLTGPRQFLIMDNQAEVKARRLNNLTEEDARRPYIDISGQRYPISYQIPMDIIGKNRFAFDQLVNQNSVVLELGNFDCEHLLIASSVGSAHDNPVSDRLLSAFRRAMKVSGFRKVRAFQVGLHAMSLLKSGARLTPSTDMPAVYDLKL